MFELTVPNLFIDVLRLYQGGEYHPVSNVEDLRERMATFYNRPDFSTNKRSNPVYTVPYHDGFGFGKQYRTLEEGNQTPCNQTPFFIHSIELESGLLCNSDLQLGLEYDSN